MKFRNSPWKTPITALLCLFLVGSALSPAHAFGWTSKATVVDYLQTITGKKTIAGQHNKEPAAQPGYYTGRVHAITGVWPGLWGGDFLFNPADVSNRQAVINQAKTEWNNGSLVALTWHVCPPTTGSGCSWDAVNSNLTDAQWNELITSGTPLNNAWKSRLDEIVPYLQQLDDAGIPAIFRPLHEMNEQWPWWGGRSGPNGSAKLFQITRDYLDGYKGLGNIIWAWNVQDNPNGNFSSYYPGHNYVDLVTLDAWYKDFPSYQEYSSLLALAPGKPIALGEVGKMPTESQLASQPNWTYFMHWSEQLEGNNTHQEIKNTYYNPRVLHQGDIVFP